MLVPFPPPPPSPQSSLASSLPDTTLLPSCLSRPSRERVGLIIPRQLFPKFTPGVDRNARELSANSSSPSLFLVVSASHPRPSFLCSIIPIPLFLPTARMFPRSRGIFNRGVKVVASPRARNFSVETEMEG